MKKIDGETGSGGSIIQKGVDDGARFKLIKRVLSNKIQKTIRS